MASIPRASQPPYPLNYDGLSIDAEIKYADLVSQINSNYGAIGGKSYKNTYTSIDPRMFQAGQIVNGTTLGTAATILGVTTATATNWSYATTYGVTSPMSQVVEEEVVAVKKITAFDLLDKISGLLFVVKSMKSK